MAKISFEEEVKLYMGAKYGNDFLDSFEIVDTFLDNNTTHGNMVCRATTSLLPERKLTITGYPKFFYRRDKNAKYIPKKYSIICDDYVVLSRKDEILDYFEKVLDGIYSKMSVSDVDIGENKSGIPSNFDFDMDIDDMVNGIRKDELFVNISVSDSFDTKDEQFREVIKRLRVIRKKLKVWVWYIGEDDNEDTTCYMGEYKNNKVRWNRLK